MYDHSFPEDWFGKCWFMWQVFLPVIKNEIISLIISPIVSDNPVYVLTPRTGSRFKGKMSPISLFLLLPRLLRWIGKTLWEEFLWLATFYILDSVSFTPTPADLQEPKTRAEFLRCKLWWCDWSCWNYGCKWCWIECNVMPGIENFCTVLVC